MKRTFILFLLSFIALFFLLTACEFEEPTCTEMPAPILINPGGTIEYTWLDPIAYPTFSWLYSGTCRPDEFRLIVSTIDGDPGFFGSEYQFLEVEIHAAASSTLVYADGSTAEAYSYTSSEPFPVGTYYWRIIPYSGDFHGDKSERKPFSVRSTCANFSAYSTAPRLVYPFDGQTVLTNSPTFLWLDENTCSLPGYYLVQVDETGAFTGYRTFESELTNWPAWNGFSLDYCTHYYWKVIPIFGYLLDAGPVSEIFEFNTAAADGSACEPGTPLPTSEAAGLPLAEVIMNTNCRTGPTVEYPIMDTLPAGSQYEILARSRQGGAWLVMDTRVTGSCWVDADLVRVIGETSGVEIIDPEPPPSNAPEEGSSPVDCSVYNQNPAGCANNPSCWWDAAAPPNGECKSR